RCAMNVVSHELGQALSYLHEVEELADQIHPRSGEGDRAEEAERIERGVLARAFAEIERARQQGVEVMLVLSMSYFRQGSLALAVLSGELTDRDFAWRWQEKAIDAFKMAIRCSPSAEAWYNLGLSHLVLPTRQSLVTARRAFLMAEQLGDLDTRYEARKQV